MLFHLIFWVLDFVEDGKWFRPNKDLSVLYINSSEVVINVKCSNFMTFLLINNMINGQKGGENDDIEFKF